MRGLDRSIIFPVMKPRSTYALLIILVGRIIARSGHSDLSRGFRFYC